MIFISITLLKQNHDLHLNHVVQTESHRCGDLGTTMFSSITLLKQKHDIHLNHITLTET